MYYDGNGNSLDYQLSSKNEQDITEGLQQNLLDQLSSENELNSTEELKQNSVDKVSSENELDITEDLEQNSVDQSDLQNPSNSKYTQPKTSRTVPKHVTIIPVKTTVADFFGDQYAVDDVPSQTVSVSS